ncbi:hypothetical protein EMCRGX_G000378 [Ephydatia muelleri]
MSRLRPWGVIILTVVALSHHCSGARSNTPKQPCKACKSFVESFQKNFKATANSNFAGGDTRWEEEKLGTYANSEVRLVEIMEDVCESSDHDCHSLVAKYEEDIERWWFKLRHKGEADLLKWLCFKHMDVCCAPGHYGPNCEPCPGGAEQPCSGHGDCKGEEEKSGLGVCSCTAGYYGDKCDSCADGYYSEGSLCLACNPACKTCGGGSSSQCGECASGYVLDDAGVCIDKDECALDPQLCKEGTYCVNTPGSHSCNACDRACHGGCSGSGASKCQSCAQGFTRSQDGFCEDNDECVLGESSCAVGTYCKNTPGSYKCAACHSTCSLACTGPGPTGCVECKDGFVKENDTCVDVNECHSGVCDVDTEVCHNLEGTYSCGCKEGFVRQKGKCAPKKRKSKKKEQPKSEQPEAVGSTGDQAASDNGVPSATVEGGDPSLLGDQLPSPDTSRDLPLPSPNISHDLPLPPSPSQPCDPTAAECAGQPPVSGDDGTAHPSSSHEEL